MPAGHHAEGKRPRIVLAGGGTGGHLFPGLALAEELVRRADVEITLCTSQRGIEQRIVSPVPLERLALPVEPLSSCKRRPWPFLRRNAAAYREASRWVRAHAPLAVVGLGGYVSAPMILAARRHRIPVYLLDQNAIPGVATVWFARLARRVYLSAPGSERHLPRHSRWTISGNPVRSAIAALAEEPRRTFDPESFTLLILGGSQGAEAINNALVDIVREHRGWFEGVTLLHQTGQRQADEVRDVYHSLGLNAEVFAFIDDMPTVYRRADLVVSRAGATTLAELACAGLPAVLIPYPHAARDHQTANARQFEEAGAVQVVPQRPDPTETAGALFRMLQATRDNPAGCLCTAAAMRRLARPTAARDIAESMLAELLQGSLLTDQDRLPRPPSADRDGATPADPLG